MRAAITVIIPCRVGSKAELTLSSLQAQTFKNFGIIIVEDTEGRGAPWARNRGFEQMKKDPSPYVLFSDDDIDWDPDALAALYDSLSFTSSFYAFSYGSYEIGGLTLCDGPFDPGRLMGINYISTMSLIKTKFFPGFDENLKRLQDWDLWLQIVRGQGKMGVYCGKHIFSTSVKADGISFGSIPWELANSIVKRKWGI